MSRIAEGVMAQSGQAMPKKDYVIGLSVGLIIGILSMPVLKMAKADLYQQLRLAIIPFFLIGTPLGLAVSHIISQKVAVIWQLAKFVVTGVLNVLVDFGTLSILIMLCRANLGINSTDVFLDLGVVITFYSVFKAISFTVSNINSYFWNKYWTFDEHGENHSQFFQFFIVSVIGFIINVAVASLIFNTFSSNSRLDSGQWALIGAAAGSIAGLAWNFLGYKFIVFKK